MNGVEVRRCLELFKADWYDSNADKQKRKIIEIRVIGNSKNETYSGYYTLDTIDKLLKDISIHQDKNIYFVLNDIKEACYSRIQRNVLIKNAENTKDTEIEYRDWILIDLDAKRLAKVSATEEEKRFSQLKANQIYAYLSKMGFYKPIVVDSGNGSHLYYRIGMENNSENTNLIKSFLEALSLMFSDDNVDVDTVVFNPSRITKLAGTVAVKGANTKERPHRESKIQMIPQEIKINPVALIKKVAETMPTPEEPTYRNNYNNPPFDLRSFINEFHIDIEREVNLSGGDTKFILKQCPFCGNPAPDAALWQRTNGGLGFKCFHNSCQGKGWKDFRSYFDQNAYDRPSLNKERITTPYKPLKLITTNETTVDKGEIWEDFCDIIEPDRNLIVSIPSGFTMLDKECYGFDKKNVVVWSGSNGSGKSSILNQVALNAVNGGFKGLIWSGELNKGRLKKWLFLQAAGRQHTKRSQYNEYDYYVPFATQTLIADWMKGFLKNYNTQYSNNFHSLMESIRTECEKNPVDFVILDNLMALDILTFDGDKNDKQTQCIWELHKLAEDLDIVLHIVIHPRKPMGFIRKNDIAGTGNLTNAADAVFIVHRINRDFDRFASEYIDKNSLDDITRSGATNIIECVKHREFGTFEGKIIHLHYELESKRLLNDRYEHWEYGWNKLSEYTQGNLEYSESKDITIPKSNFYDDDDNDTFEDLKFI